MPTTLPRPGHDVEDPRREADALRQPRQFEARQRRDLMGQQHEGVARHQRRTELAGGQRRRIVPGRQPDHDTIRVATDLDLLVGIVRGDDVAFDAAGVLGSVAQEGLHRADLAAGLRQRLALFERHDAGQSLGIGDHRIGESGDEASALDGRQCGPGRLRATRGRQRLERILGGALRDGGDDRLGRGVLDLDLLPAAGRRQSPSMNMLALITEPFPKS